MKSFIISLSLLAFFVFGSQLSISQERVVLSKIKNGQLIRSRPVIPFPGEAVCDGKGDPDVHTNYTFVTDPLGNVTQKHRDNPPDSDISKNKNKSLKMSISKIIQRLKEGNQRFVHNVLEGKFQDSDRRASLLEGQDPFSVVLSCADSRVVPELIFDTGLGELFTVRVAGNVANTSSIASIEYAIAHLGTKMIVVLAHESCGAVTAAVHGGDHGENLNHLLSHITPAIEHSLDKEVNEVAKKNAKLTAIKLLSDSEIIQKAVHSGNLKIVPAYYQLESGQVDFFD